MARLTLCFRKDGEGEEYRPLTKFEINEVTSAAQSASAITHVMAVYAGNLPQGETAGDTLGIYGGVFRVLEWLMEPVTDYLACYAGNQAEAENKDA